MLHESPHSEQSSYLPNPYISKRSALSDSPRVAQEKKEPSLTSLEPLFATLRGEALLIAALAYGLKVHISSLVDVRIRDVEIFDGTIEVANRERLIPSSILEEIRECVQERVCGYSAIRDDLLFSAESFAELTKHISELESCAGYWHKAHEYDPASLRADSTLRILGWLHHRRARAHGIHCESPLELFSKGPRIVRRGPGGVIRAYYLWRAKKSLHCRSLCYKSL